MTDKTFLRLLGGIRFVRATVAQHGGGWSGVCSVASRTSKVVRTLGWRGLLRRIRAARTRTAVAARVPVDITFPAPTPLTHLSLRVGIMVHVFYADLVDELATQLAHIPVPFTLLVSVVDPAAQKQVEARFRQLSQVLTLDVRVVANRGRDIAPLLVTFRDAVLALDVICHLHTKKSIYTGKEQGAWRRYLIDSLLGSRQRVIWILGMFQATPELGMVYPESYTRMPLWAHTWLNNAEAARQWAPLLNIEVNTHAYFDFPAGSMFWARVDALRPLYELGLKTNSFPVETGQTDATLQHAVERLFGLVVHQQNRLVGILPANGTLALSTQGARNWATYFAAPLGEKIAQAAVGAKLVSFDIFDTLVMRPFLTPAGARAYLANRIEQRFGLKNFADLRARAETAARNACGHDANLSAIYAALSRLPEARDSPIAAIQALELDTEQRLLRPRAACIAAAQAMIDAHLPILGLSDMYLDQSDLRRVLPHAASKALPRILVSCETGQRKDDGEAWQHLPANEGVDANRWLHVGDNERADVQAPQERGFMPPVHVLRPSALLEVVPALRSLRTGAHTGWMNDLCLGLTANRLSDLADDHPEAFGDVLRINQPETLGYLVFGPLIADYMTWMSRLALQQGIRKILFLSREGYLLERVYRRLQAAVPALADIEGIYFSASRRGVGTPSLRNIDDLAHLLGNTYTGTLHDLLDARLGKAIADAVSATLGANPMRSEVYLPEMRQAIVERLRPVEDAILAQAQAERRSYLDYWRQHVGDTPVMVSDLGYAGTIQTHLARLTGRPIGGAYFAVNNAITQTTVNDGWAKARFHDGRISTDTTSPVMHHNLVLEAVLTAPAGQFSHFESSKAQPIYLPDSRDPSTYPTLARIHDGIDAFMADMCAVTGKDMLHVAMDPTLVQEPLACLGAGRWQPGPWFEHLHVMDQYTGRGSVTTL